METVNFIEKFIIYIEDHIRDNIDYDGVLDDMGVEPKSFITIFTSLVGMTPYEYQVKRRMTEIAYELKAGHRRLIDIAKYYGYYDVDAFKRAYQKAFGISPYETERQMDALDLTERISFEVVPVDRPKYPSRYARIESFRITGAVRTFSLQDYDSRMKYEFLAYLERNNILDELLRYNNGSTKGIIMHERYIDGDMELTIGVASSLESPFQETYTESSEFVIFESQGIPSVTAQEIYQYIFRRWHLKESRDLNCNFSIEVLKSQRDFTSDESRVQVWQALYAEN
ncbi:helix-turn-helix transcriptional regulator [Salinicoccus sp. ID82-1]|uniref:Helix-turn-helix transcriptional regulator n=1 Tax=Salinicoccus cyprini TaxID=2493691 RepID=A0A558AZ13_9STAP|nr:MULTISPECIES: AraC family transcriptional regulator [Salinicoccus]MCG1009058.1 helix-turn-helix transcriptional regulator [Salinicoccus sp. ID82-1]TVT29505.1 helix-turn-helix transcriptional regulator [Salinicoccus cyprini]